ncbi:MAG: Ig-like domain-containing protein [Planctomycetota bacterium]
MMGISAQLRRLCVWNQRRRGGSASSQRSRVSKRRRLGERIVAEVTVAEPRVLLSGVTAVDDSAFAAQGQTVTVDVLANDLGGGTVTAVSGGSAGETTLLEDGRISYQSTDSFFTGTDTFNYTVTAGDGSTQTASVSVGVGYGPQRPSIDSNNNGELAVTTGAGFTPDLWTGFDGSSTSAFTGGAPSDDYSYTLEFENWRTLEDGSEVQDASDFLTVTADVEGDGSWTYSESFVTGTPSAEEGSWSGQPLSYTFDVSSGADGSTTYTLNVSENASFSFEGDDESVSASSQTNYTVTTTTDSSGTVTSTDRYGSYGYSFSYSASGTYDFDEDVSAADSGDGSEGDGDSAGSGSTEGDAGDGDSGDGDAGAGNDGDAADEDETVNYAGSGSYSASYSEYAQLTFTVNTISYSFGASSSLEVTESATITGSDGSGSYSASASAAAAFDYTIGLTMGAGGEFHLTSGSGTSSLDESADSSFSYGGGWSDDESSGTYDVSSSGGYVLGVESSATVVAGVWDVSGEGTYTEDGSGSSSYTAEGGFDYEAGDGTVSGTWDQSASSSGSYALSLEFSLAENPAGSSSPPTGDEGDDIDTGNGYELFGNQDSESGDGDEESAYVWVLDAGDYGENYNDSFSFSYEASGDYTSESESSAGDGFTMSGTISESGSFTAIGSGGITADLVAETFEADATYTETGKDDFSYSGSGTITHGEMSGTVSESGAAKSESTITLNSEMTEADEEARVSGSGSSSASGNGSFAIAMEGTYTEGDLSGTASYDENVNGQYAMSATFSLEESDEEFEVDSLVLSVNETASQNQSYDISGAITEGDLSGTASASGASGFESAFVVSYGEESEDGPTDLSSVTYSSYERADSSYDLSGSFSEDTDGGTLSGSAHSSGTAGYDISVSVESTLESGEESSSGEIAMTSYSTSADGYTVSGEITGPPAQDGGGYTESGSGDDSGGSSEMSGSATQSENTTTESQMAIGFELGAEDEWDLTQATVTTSINSTASGSQSLSGSYSDGTLSGEQSDSSSYTASTTLVMVGVGSMTAASGSDGGDEGAGNGDDGSDTGSDSGAGGDSSDDGGVDNGSGEADGGGDDDGPEIEWDFTGTGSTTLQFNANGSRSAEGTTSSGNMTGTSSQSDSYTMASSRSTELAYVPAETSDSGSGDQGGSGSGEEGGDGDAGGTWEIVSGMGSTTMNASGDSESSMSGSDDSGDITITQSSSSTTDYSLDQSTSETYDTAEGDWIETGQQSILVNFAGSDSSSGNGSFSSNGMDMTMSVDSSSSYAGFMTDTSELNSDGEWERTEATSAIGITSTDESSLSGSGSYSTTTADISMSGTQSMSSSSSMTISFDREGTWSPDSEGAGGDDSGNDSGGGEHHSSGDGDDSGDSGGEETGSWSYSGSGTISGSMSDSSSQSADGSWSESITGQGGTDQSSDGGGSISGTVSQSSSNQTTVGIDILLGVDSDGEVEINSGTITVGGGSSFESTTSASGSFAAPGMDSGMMSFDEDTSVTGTTSIDIQIGYSDDGWEIDHGVVEGSTNMSSTSTTAGGGSWSNSWGDSNAGGSSSGTATFSSNSVTTDDTSFNATYNGTGWDQTTTATGSSNSDTLSTATSESTFWHTSGDLPITGESNRNVNDRTVVTSSYARATSNGETTQDESHSVTTTTHTSMTSGEASGSRSWSYTVGQTNHSGDEFLLATSSSNNDSTTVITSDTVFGETTDRTHETWNNTSQSSYEYNRTDASDWDHSWTANDGTEYESEGFTNRERSSTRQTNNSDVGNRTTTVSPDDTTVVSGNRTVNNTSSGGWDDSYQGYSRSKTITPGVGQQDEPGDLGDGGFGGDLGGNGGAPSAWEQWETRDNSEASVSWSETTAYETDYATGITTGDTNPVRTVSGGGDSNSEHRHSWDDGNGDSGDTGFETFVADTWDADESNFGEAPGENSGLQITGARTVTGAGISSDKGGEVQAANGMVLVGMIGGLKDGVEGAGGENSSGDDGGSSSLNTGREDDSDGNEGGGNDQDHDPFKTEVIINLLILDPSGRIAQRVHQAGVFFTGYEETQIVFAGNEDSGFSVQVGGDSALEVAEYIKERVTGIRTGAVDPFELLDDALTKIAEQRGIVGTQAETLMRSVVRALPGGEGAIFLERLLNGTVVAEYGPEVAQAINDILSLPKTAAENPREAAAIVFMIAIIKKGKLKSNLNRVKLKKGRLSGFTGSPGEGLFAKRFLDKQSHLHIYRTENGKGLGDFVIYNTTRNKAFAVELKIEDSFDRFKISPRSGQVSAVEVAKLKDALDLNGAGRLQITTSKQFLNSLNVDQLFRELNDLFKALR